MALKIAFLALALMLVWALLFRPRRRPPDPPGRGPRPVTPPPPAPAALERCAGCGVFRLPGGRCDCTAPAE